MDVKGDMRGDVRLLGAVLGDRRGDGRGDMRKHVRGDSEERYWTDMSRNVMRDATQNACET